MENWSVHHLFQKATDLLNDEQACQIQKYAGFLIAEGLPVVFSLGHLAKITGTDYGFLHDTVNRKRDSVNYRMFAISKRSGGRRFIHAVGGKLLTVHQFINSEILQKTNPHSSSFAFHRSGGILRCATQHCGARWILQFDLSDFFFSVTESHIYRIFQKLGYRNLLAFEMARLCTTTHLPKAVKRKQKMGSLLRNLPSDIDDERHHPYVPQRMVGVLPQGASTSPMLSNLAALALDEGLQAFARESGFVYTRYADDLTFSSTRLPAGKSIGELQREVINIIRKKGFIENREKIRIAGPGSRKIVLGLLVDGKHPRLSRQMCARIDRHLYASNKFGIVETARHEGFDSAYGFYNHLHGLIAFTKDVDLKRWEVFKARLSRISAPI